MEQLHENNDQQTGTIYSCPMHPEIKEDKPGKCLHCGMDLVPVTSEKEE